MSEKKDLVQIIRDNPGCTAVIDNDGWMLVLDRSEEWDGENLLASDQDEIVPLGDGGYGTGSSYGGDILQALAVIVGITVESV